MSNPDKIDKIFEMLVRRTMRKGGTKRINPKKQLINAYFEICFHEYILKSFNLEEKLGSIMQFHPEYASDDKENTSTKQDCMFKYDYFQSLSLPEAVELVNLVQEALGKSLVSI